MATPRVIRTDTKREKLMLDALIKIQGIADMANPKDPDFNPWRVIGEIQGIVEGTLLRTGDELPESLKETGK